MKAEFLVVGEACKAMLDPTFICLKEGPRVAVFLCVFFFFFSSEGNLASASAVLQQ